MSDSPDVQHPSRDEAFQSAVDLARHILENANSYHTLSSEDFPGRDRVRFAILILMLEEAGKLINMVRECERSAKADYLSVRIEDYNDNCLNGRRALGQILEELRIMDKAFEALGKGEGERMPEPAFIKEDFCTLKERLLYMALDRSKRDLSFIPPGDLMDRLAGTIERNALAAGDYIHDLGRALGLWITLDLKPRKGDEPHSIRYA
ncbi:MAG: hypothetical protein GX369_00450 [Euryarchaeota archaeon]|nr:hypothetical protein [Euryarchaeota archaeon]